VKIKQKEAAGIAEKRSGRRGPGSVFGSWTAGPVSSRSSVTPSPARSAKLLEKPREFCPFNSISFHFRVPPQFVGYNILNGVIRGFGLVNRYLVTSFSVVPRGTEGAVSLEGTVAGLVASVILAAVAYSINLVLCYLSGSPINCVSCSFEVVYLRMVSLFD
jgi:hypothetical protein